MLIVFFDCEGGVHHKNTPPGQTINKEYYLNVPQLRYAIQRKHPQLQATHDWQLHHNAPTHASRLLQRFLAKYHITQVTAPLRPRLVTVQLLAFPKTTY